MKELTIHHGRSEELYMLHDKAMLQVDGSGKYEIQASLDGEHWSVHKSIAADCKQHSRTVVVELLAGVKVRVVCVTGHMEAVRYAFSEGVLPDEIIDSEHNRIVAEAERIEAEQSRENAERARVQAEASREEAEAQRVFRIVQEEGNASDKVMSQDAVTRSLLKLGQGEDIELNASSNLQLRDRSSIDGMGYVILRKNKTFAEQVTKANTIYEIRYDFDLEGDEVELSEYCELRFNGGCVENGTIIGSDTICGTYEYSIFKNCTLQGTWKCFEASSLMFEGGNDNVLFANMSVLSETIRLSSNRDYIIEKTGKLNIKATKLYSTDSIKPIVCLSNGENSKGNNLSGICFTAKTVCIENIHFKEDFIDGTANNATIGSALTSSSEDYEQSIIFNSCIFSGNYSSSCFSSSTIGHITARNCFFTDIVTEDHCLYGSTRTSSYDIDSIKVSNAELKNGGFKVRNVNMGYFRASNIQFINIAGYPFVLDDVAANSVEIKHVRCIFFEGRNVLFMSLNNADIGLINIEDVDIESNSNDVRPMIYSSSNTYGNVGKVVLADINSLYCTIPYFSTNIVVERCNIGITYITSNVHIINSQVHSTSKQTYLIRNANDINIENSNLDVNVTYLLKCPSDSDVKLSIQSSQILTLARNLMEVENPTEDFSVNLMVSKNSEIEANQNYEVITGANRGVLKKNIKGSTEYRPNNLQRGDSGFVYFDATLNKPIWWTGSKWVDATGVEV